MLNPNVYTLRPTTQKDWKHHLPHHLRQSQRRVHLLPLPLGSRSSRQIRTPMEVLPKRGTAWRAVQGWDHYRTSRRRRLEHHRLHMCARSQVLRDTLRRIIQILFTKSPSPPKATVRRPNKPRLFCRLDLPEHHLNSILLRAEAVVEHLHVGKVWQSPLRLHNLFIATANDRCLRLPFPLRDVTQVKNGSERCHLRHLTAASALQQ